MWSLPGRLAIVSVLHSLPAISRQRPPWRLPCQAEPLAAAVADTLSFGSLAAACLRLLVRSLTSVLARQTFPVARGSNSSKPDTSSQRV